MDRGNLSRRGFLRRALAALTVGAGLPAWYAREVLAFEEDKKPVASGDKIIMGAIGIGSPQSRGRAIAHDALRAGKGNVRYVAVCDVDERHVKNAVEDMKKNGQDVKGYRDFRELLDRKDIQAVTIATPDHWHVLVAIEALKKGKDVYCEKPLTLTIDEGKALRKVVRQTGRVFQVGSQQRSDPRFRLACELVRNGRIGKIKTVETRIGANPQGGPFPVEKPPKELDWDFWLGPTPKVDYVARRCHYEFRWWYEYSGGKMTDWGAHHNDIAQWGLGMDDSGPVAVWGMGAPPDKRPNCYNCHPIFQARFTYANGAELVCTDRGENGVRFEGEKGQWIFVSRGRIAASDRKLLEEPLPRDAVRLYVSNNHMGNFLECVRTRKPTICTAEVGHRSVTVCHLGNIAIRSGKKLKWDPQAERFVGDDEANRWLSREMRAPWKLEA
ncbi:MAG TPA: Gfo/Idh/MocA family oxidoreductase [Gemmataceae bacterium]|nr:Gfo/Idh/MocA family oxidoreductase [Gemmataceae bacterium]